MKHFASTIAVVCALSITTIAGEIPSGGCTKVPDDQTLSSTTPTQDDAATSSSGLQLLNTDLDIIQMIIDLLA